MLKSKILALLLITAFLINATAQNDRKVIDSLFVQLELAKDEQKIDILNELAFSYWRYSLDSSLYYATEALNIAHILKSQKGISDAYNRIGNVYHFRNEIEKALEYYKKCLQIRLNLGDSKSISNIYNNIASLYSDNGLKDSAIIFYDKALQESLKRDDKNDLAAYNSNIGIAYQDIGNYKKALEHLLKALEITQQIDNPNALGRVNNILGNIYQEISGYDDALNYYFKALDIFQNINNQAGISMVYNNLGIVYQTMGDQNKALEYYKKTLEMDNASGLLEGQANAYNNIGTVYDAIGDKNKALEYYNKALALNTELNNSDGIGTAMNNIGLIYLDLGNFDKATTNLHKAAEISKSLNDNYSLANNYNNLANLFLRQKQYSKAQEYLNMAIEITKQIETKEWLVESYELYHKLYIEQNNYKKALEYYKLYTEVKASIDETINSNRIADIKIKYETDYVEAENELLKKDNEIHVLQINRQKNIMNYWLGFTVLFLLLAIISFSRFRLKKRTNSLLEQKNSELQEANQKLLVSEKNLKELNATKDRFFSIIAHDLKNPFQSLLGFSETLYTDIDKYTKEEIKEYSRIILETSQNLFNLLGNLLQWAKSQLGNMPLNPKEIDIHNAVEDVISVLNITAQNKEINIKNLVTNNIVVWADKHVIATVLRNLISNAIKFTNKGGVITISAIKEENDIKISVNDNGKGISQENIDRLFKIEEGFSTKGTENESGTGLGLILCNELLTQSNGTLNVESSLGKGSTFHFTLPGV